MNIQQVRNATIIVEYGGKKILVDPMLGKKGSMPPFPFSRNQHLRNLKRFAPRLSPLMQVAIAFAWVDALL